MNERIGFFQGTEMPTAGWWPVLWPDPAGVLVAMGIELCSFQNLPVCTVGVIP